MKKAPKKKIELSLDFTVFNPPKPRKKVIPTSFDLIEPRPTLTLSKIPNSTKIHFSPSSRPYIQKPEIPSSSPSTSCQIQSLVSYFSHKSDKFFQQKSSFYSQVQQDCLDFLNNSSSSLEKSPQLHSWYLSHYQKFTENLAKSLEHNHSLHTQQLKTLNSYYKDQLIKFKTLKRILELCTSKSRPFDRLNTHFHSILNENLDLKRRIARIPKVFE